MYKIILKITIILLLGMLTINIESYAKYYITENLEAININIVLQ